MDAERELNTEERISKNKNEIKSSVSSSIRPIFFSFQLLRILRKLDVGLRKILEVNKPFHPSFLASTPKFRLIRQRYPPQPFYQ
jgi:hypothetical protein